MKVMEMILYVKIAVNGSGWQKFKSWSVAIVTLTSLPSSENVSYNKKAMQYKIFAGINIA